MTARVRVNTRSGPRATATAFCRWVRTPQGGLHATWRPGWRVAPGNDAAEHTTAAAARLTCDGQRVHAVSRSGGSARQPPVGRWIAGGFIAALYALVAFAGIAIVVRV